MIAPFHFVAHRPLAELNFALCTFLQRSITQSKFNEKLFPKRYWSYLKDSHRKPQRDKFKELHEKLWLCTDYERKEVWTVCKRARRIAKMCSDPTEALCELLAPNDNTALINLYQSLKSFCVYLYEDVLRSDGYYAAFGETFDQHYQKFYSSNRRLKHCPFCGDTRLSHLRREMDYDHFLNKATYPLLSVNLRNLVPMCKICNEIHKKTEDVLRSNGSRRKVFYPYVSSSVSQQPQIEVKAQKDKNNQWHLSISSVDPQFTEQTETWKGVFNIEERYLGYFKKDTEEWWKSLIYEHWQNLHLSGSPQTKTAVDEQAEMDKVNRTRQIILNKLSDFEKTHPLSILQTAYLKYLSTAEDAEIIGLLRTTLAAS